MLFSVVGVTAIAASYKVEFLPGRFSTGTGPDPIVAEKNTVIILPGISFEREGYIQTGWATSASGSKKNYELNAEFTVTKATKLYPYWEAKKIQVTFAPGDFGIGDADVIEVDSGRSATAPGAIFSRDGYIMVGWSSVNGGDLELGLSDTTDPITEDITYYPVWEICDYSIDVDKTSENFGNVCVDFALPSAAHMTIENKGNVTLKYTLPVTSSYNVTVVSGSLNLEAGDSVTIAIQPKAGIGAGDYDMDLVFDCNFDVSDVVFNAFFSVSEHSYDRYISNGDATYEQDGTKTAQCSNGCGNTDIIVDEGSMKVYGAEFNTVDGLLKKYVHHRTVRATAYGSGTDNIREDGTIAVGTKRYRPVSWYVNEEFNGEFKNGNYDINFVHTSYGDYTLTVKYVEEVYTCDNHTGPVFFCEECSIK